MEVYINDIHFNYVNITELGGEWKGKELNGVEVEYLIINGSNKIRGTMTLTNVVDETSIGSIKDVIRENVIKMLKEDNENG